MFFSIQQEYSHTHFLHNKAKRMCLKGKCKNHKVKIRSEKKRLRKTGKDI